MSRPFEVGVVPIEAGYCSTTGRMVGEQAAGVVAPVVKKNQKTQCDAESALP
jgi:hypothetical protein